MADGNNMQLLTEPQNQNLMVSYGPRRWGPGSGHRADYGFAREMPCKISNYGEFSEEQEVWTYRLTLSAKFDRSTGRAIDG
jgi:hypothetical protein